MSLAYVRTRLIPDRTEVVCVFANILRTGYDIEKRIIRAFRGALSASNGMGLGFLRIRLYQNVKLPVYQNEI